MLLGLLVGRLNFVAELVDLLCFSSLVFAHIFELDPKPILSPRDPCEYSELMGPRFFVPIGRLV